MAQSAGAARMDLVYLWVDGSHPQSQAYRRRHRVEAPYQTSNHHELLYSLRSVQTHAPWVRRIVVVSECGIVPEWAAAFPAVEWVDQDVVLPPDAVPCFNNMVLEAYLHRLPGLSEPFLYMNDDYFLGRPVRPELWTAPWTFYRSHATIPATAPRQQEWLHMTVRTADACAKRWGHRPSYLQHVPYLMSAQAMDGVLAAFPAVRAMAVRRAKRHPDDVVPLLLMQEWVRHEMRAQRPSRVLTAQKQTTPSYFFANLQLPTHQQALRRAMAAPYHFITLNDSFADNAVVAAALQGTLELLWPRIAAPDAGRAFGSLGAALAWTQQQPGPVWLRLGTRKALPLEHARALVPATLAWEVLVFPPTVPPGSRLQRATALPAEVAWICVQPHVRAASLQELTRLQLYQPRAGRQRELGFGSV